MAKRQGSVTIFRLFSVLLIATAGYLIKLSYGAFAKWQEYLKLDDFSGAELYELEFFLTALSGARFEPFLPMR